MDQQLLQRTRYLLQTRFRRINTAPEKNFGLVCQQILNWLEKHPILSAVLQHLDNVSGDHNREIDLLITMEDFTSTQYWDQIRRKRSEQISIVDVHGNISTNLEEHAAACLKTLRVAIQRPDLHNLLAVYLTKEDYSGRSSKDPLEPIRNVAVHDLYEYLDEQLDGINAVNGLLQKYKQNVEWFQRERIQQIIDEGYAGKKDERALALHLQQYVFDQGVDFVVEPSSVSGEVDLILRDPSGQYTIIDAKYIRRDSTPSQVTRKIAEGFNQVARYCNDYNQGEGFLAVFVNDDIAILLDVEQNDGFRFFKIGGSVIYYIELNISERPSASKAGKAKQVTITRDQLLDEIQEMQQEQQ